MDRWKRGDGCRQVEGGRWVWPLVGSQGRTASTQDRKTVTPASTRPYRGHSGTPTSRRFTLLLGTAAACSTAPGTRRSWVAP